MALFPWLGSKGSGEADNHASHPHSNMNQQLMTEIQEATSIAAKDVVRAQIAKGAPNKGLSKTRHAAIVADVVAEILASYPTRGEDNDEARWQRLVMRVVFSGSLLNASQLRQQLEKAGILAPEGTMSSEYGVE